MLEQIHFFKTDIIAELCEGMCECVLSYFFNLKQNITYLNAKCTYGSQDKKITLPDVSTEIICFFLFFTFFSHLTRFMTLIFSALEF